jgi:hypothetical protein
MAAELEELRRRFASLRDEELLRIVTQRRGHYRQVALSLAEEELMRRGVRLAATVGHIPAATFSATPARGQTRGTAFWLGILLIGGACLWVAGMVDEAWRAPAGASEDGYWLLRAVLIVLISVAGGRLMKWWESVD